MSRSPGVLIAVALAAALGMAAAAAAPGSSSEVEPSTAAIAGYRSAVARAAPAVVTVHSAVSSEPAP
jgi:hypothetical protein